MLGRAADHFMLSQMKERITAVPSNAEGQSLPIADRERAGTSRFTMPSTIKPGPGNEIASGWMPGATSVQAPQTIALSNGYYPGEGFNADSPAAAESDSFLGAEATEAPAAPAVAPVAPLLTSKTMMILGAVAIGVYFLSKKK